MEEYYYTIGINEEECNDHFTPEELKKIISINKDKIYYVDKTFTNLYNCNNNQISMTLYTSECKLDPETYINNYTNLHSLYGENTLDSFDIYVIRLFNS